MAVEEFNIKEEIIGIIEGCIRCGMCNSHCPVLRVMKREQYSPRGKTVILDNKFYEKIVYSCTLCGVCERKCPLNLKLCSAFLKARQVLVLQDKEISENKRMIENLKKSGSVFGKRS